MLLSKVKSSRSILYIIFIVSLALIGGYYILGDKKVVIENAIGEVVENIVTKVIPNIPIILVNLRSSIFLGKLNIAVGNANTPLQKYLVQYIFGVFDSTQNNVNESITNNVYAVVEKNVVNDIIKYTSFPGI